MFTAVLASAAPEQTRKFVLFGTLHLGILATTILLPLALSRLTRREQRPRLARILASALAVVLLSDSIFAICWGYHEQRITRWADALPMHLCDWASIAVMITLVWRRQLLYELAYFWGLAGTLQAVLTPDLSEQFPSPFFISFFVEHCGIIVAVLFLTWGLSMRPQPGALWRVFGWTQFYVVCAGLVDWLSASDYGYLAHKPVHGSLLDFLGPWPWYILALEGLAVVFFTVLYLPFLGRQRSCRP
jgi:hypothetical integral membrane protein (TIGR02206 family)